VKNILSAAESYFLFINEFSAIFSPSSVMQRFFIGRNHFELCSHGIYLKFASKFFHSFHFHLIIKILLIMKLTITTFNVTEVYYIPIFPYYHSVIVMQNIQIVQLIIYDI
jgi:F0F1-type ATP synthase assembly protein I